MKRYFMLLPMFIFYATWSSCLSDKMLIIGHRGACGYEPENTLLSFQKALDLGVDMIELDVFVCLTGEVVVIHDDKVESIAHGSGKVEHMSLQELQTFLIEGRGRIPTLQEVIELVDRRVPINIELKGFDTACAVTKVINYYLQRGWKSTDFIVSSFNHEQIGEFKKLCPSIKTIILFSRSWKELVCPYLPNIIGQWLCVKDDTHIIETAVRYKASYIGLAVCSVTQSLVQAAHDYGFPVYVWTVDDKKTIDEMRTLGVDGVFSNYPDRVR